MRLGNHIGSGKRLQHVFGVSWDESADSYSRTGRLKARGLAIGQSPGDAYLPIHAQMRRCILNSGGNIQYYLDPNDSTKKANGNAANLDGTDGQVMVEIPAFYVKYNYSGTTHTWEIATEPGNGFTLHPAFEKNGSVVDYRYYGAYEAVPWDAGAGAYNDGTGDKTTNFNGGAVDTSNDKIGSVSGFKPVTDERRSEFRQLAGNVGTGWRIEDFWLRQAVLLLYLTEYADFNSQSMIGNGNTAYTSFDYTECVGPTGFSNDDGNGTNASNTAFGTLATDGTDTNDGTTQKEYMSYRGIENFYGSVWKFLDGFNVKNVEATSKSEAWVSNDDTVFADDTETGYTKLTDALSLNDGYQDTLVQLSFALLPTTVGATSSTQITDKYWTAYDSLSAGFGTAWRVVFEGGKPPSGSEAGVCTLYVNYSSDGDFANLGARLSY